MTKRPEKLGKYKIVAVLGEGSMGIVYKAIDPDIQEYVALKTIHKKLLEGKDRAVILQRFINEVKAGRLLRHPNIVAMYDYQEDEDTCFLVMEYIEGTTLKETIQEHPDLGKEEICRIMSQLLDGLQEAHKQGVVHRDIKPENLILKEDGDVRIADFGVARLDSSTMTTDGSILGSPSYMSPEQCMGKQVDARSDLFSAGVVLYQLLTGEKPFSGMAFMETMQQILHVQPAMPSTRNPVLESEWDAVVNKALAKHVDDRFQTATDFKQALTKIVGHQFVDRRELKPSRWLQWLGLSLIIAVLAGGYWWATQPKKLVKDNQSPVVTTTPISKVEADNTVSMDQQLNQLLTKYECDELSYTIDVDDAISVSGYVSEDQNEALKSALSRLSAKFNQQIDNKLIPLLALNCEALSILQPFVEKNKVQKHGLQIEASQHSSVYVQGERPVFEVITPDFAGYLYVDYFMADGKVFHLLPTNIDSQSQFEAQQQVLIGNNGTSRQWQIVKPYGKEIMSVIVSDLPLFVGETNDIEASETYLSKLRLALFELEDTVVAADNFVITTISQVEAEQGEK
jgi:serine/threonine-protein kinase